MRVGINLLFLKQGIAGGTETYSYELIKSLLKVSPHETEYIIFCSSKLNLTFLDDNSIAKVVKYNIGNSVAYRCMFEQFVFPFKLKKYKLDVLHSLGYTGPVTIKHHIVTIHDANAFVHTDMAFAKRFFLSSLMKLTAKACTHIIAVSAFAKEEVIKYLKVPAEKITVIYEACKFNKPANDFPLPDEFSFLNNKCFFVALSSTSKNKNIATLINAFSSTSTKQPHLNLVLIGHLPADNSIQQQINESNLSNKVFITGYVNEETLTAIFQRSIAFVFPSLYEGFGLPLLEAQNFGVPVISSNRASLPEIGNESVLYFNPLSSEELSEKMLCINNNTELQQSLIEKGLKNIKRFSWNAAAQQTLLLYNLLYSQH